jgi:hypothetical protein
MHGQCDSVSLFVAEQRPEEISTRTHRLRRRRARRGRGRRRRWRRSRWRSPRRSCWRCTGSSSTCTLHADDGRSRITQRFRLGAEQGEREKKKACDPEQQRVPMVRVDAAGAGAELVHVGLAGEDGPAGAQLGDARRVGLAAPRRAQPPRPARGRVRQAVDLVLHAHQHAVQRGQRRPCTHHVMLSCLAADQRNE